ncbi:MAG TPA: DUF1203 domain-containing protein [Thermoanaerobaculia bacterium]|nr:DUF1203 domain-containing protein [Thermoanaerobaculia bacterium]
MENRYRIAAIPTAFAGRVRAGSVPSLRRVDPDPHQCRHCLTLSAPGEAVLLVSYPPFATEQPYAERGPIFVHERECPRWREEEGYPPQFPKRRAVLRAYDRDEAQIESRVVGDAGVDEVLADLFTDPRTAFVHARNVAEGCFMFRIDRAAPPAAP